jgi:hypothetical protein
MEGARKQVQEQRKLLCSLLEGSKYSGKKSRVEGVRVPEEGGLGSEKGGFLAGSIGVQDRF